MIGRLPSVTSARLDRVQAGRGHLDRSHKEASMISFENLVRLRANFLVLGLLLGGCALASGTDE